jgi:hypothetical protein
LTSPGRENFVITGKGAAGDDFAAGRRPKLVWVMVCFSAKPSVSRSRLARI